ncbi:MAG TPA: hypothetical protein VI424_08880 [Terriglobales bacterium]
MLSAVASLLVLLLWPPAPAQETVSPEPELAYYSVLPAFEYHHRFDSVSAVDFRNLELNIFDAKGKVRMDAKLKNGIYETSGMPRNWVAINSISYFDFQAGKPRYALVSFLWTWTGADAASYGGVQLFTIQNGWLMVVQQIFFTARHAGAGATFDPATGALFVNSSHYLQVDAHCCPSRQDVIRYAWSGHDFRQVDMKTFPVAAPPNLRIQTPKQRP